MSQRSAKTGSEARLDAARAEVRAALDMRDQFPRNRIAVRELPQ